MSVIEHERTGLDEAKKFLSDQTLQMCDGINLDLYLGELVSQGQSQCSNIWSKGVIAYRCRTCQINDSRSAQTFVLNHKTLFVEVKVPMDRALSLYISNLKAAVIRIGQKSCRAQQSDLGFLGFKDISLACIKWISNVLDAIKFWFFIIHIGWLTWFDPQIGAVLISNWTVYHILPSRRLIVRSVTAKRS